MGAKFNIYITAFDKASGVVNKVNKSLAGINEPVSKFGRAMQAFSRESGIKGLVKHLGDTAKGAEQVASKVASIAAPLAAVFGAGSVAAVAGMANAWGQLGREITLTSMYTQQSTEQLQKWMGAASALGVESSATTQTLASFSQGIQDALYGRNQELLGLMSQLHIVIGATGSGVKDQTEVLFDFAEKVKKLAETSPQAAKKAIDIAGLTTLAPLLMKGKKGIQELMDIQKKFGYEMDKNAIARADAFAIKVYSLNTALKGLRSRIGDQLIPVFTPLVSAFSKFVALNGDKIAKGIADAFVPFAEALMRVDWTATFKGIMDFFKSVNEAITGTIGWKNAMIGLAVVLNAGLILNVLSLGKSILFLGFSIARVALAVIPLLVRSFIALGIALLTTPIGWIIIGIGALGFIVYRLITRWTEFKNFWKKLWADIVDTIDKAASRIARNIPIISPAFRLGQEIYKATHSDPNAPDLSRVNTFDSPTSGARTASPFSAPGRSLEEQARLAFAQADEDKKNGRVQVDVVLHNAPRNTRYSVTSTGAAEASARTQSSLSSSMSP